MSAAQRPSACPRRSSCVYLPQSAPMRQFLLAVAVLVSCHAACADSAADARAIVERAIKARGDKPGDKLPPAVMWKEKITLKIDPTAKEHVVLDTTWTLAPPDKVRIDMKIEFSGNTFEAVYVVSGESSWVLVNGAVQENANDQPGQALREMNRMWVSSLNPLLCAEGYKLSTAKEQQVNGKPAAGVEVREGQRPVVTLYFDKETGLLVKSAARVNDITTGDTDVLEEAVLSGYKETADGRKYHTRTTVTRDDKAFYTSERTEPKVLKQADPKLFEKPKP